MGFGGDLMEKIIIEEVNDLMIDITNKCEVCVSIIFLQTKNKEYNYCITSIFRTVSQLKLTVYSTYQF